MLRRLSTICDDASLPIAKECYLTPVESLKLSQFFRIVAQWPRQENEGNSIAERIRDILEVPYAVFWTPELGARTAGTLGEVSREAVLEQLKAHPSARQQEGVQIRQLQVSGSSPWNANDSTPFLSMVPILSQIRSEGAARESRERLEFGWILVGSQKVLNPRQELALLGAVAHCASLAGMNHMENALALRDQFLSIASHELKTPLTSIYGILQLQERMLRPKKDVISTPEQEKQRSFFKIVIRQVERLNELIDGLLDVSRIQNGRFMVEPSECDAAVILRETVQSRLAIIAQDAGVRIQLECDPSVLAWLDPVRFEEVITNLGMNAIRFSPEGGVVWIKLKQDEESTLLTVRDQGPSVPDTDRSRIFQPFERAQRTARLGGLGLGLFISRQIAQLHGGDVSLIESLQGRGNLFSAKFPRRMVQRKSA